MVNRKKVLHKQQSSFPEKTDWLPLPAMGGVLLGLFLFFIVAEIALAQQIHVIHWAWGLAGRSPATLSVYFGHGEASHPE